MAVYTQVDTQTIETFINNYDIGNLRSVKGIAEGVENSNYLITTTQANYILTLYEKRVKSEDLPFFVELMSHLALKNFPCPEPIVQKDGTVISQLNDRDCTLVSFLNGVSVVKPSTHHCYAVGKYLAHLHEYTTDFASQRHNALSQPHWRPLYERSKPRTDELSKSLPDMLERELDWLDIHWPKDLPSGVIHADLFPDNVFFIEEKLSGIFDFYFAATDILAYDLAVTLNAWCFDEKQMFNPHLAGAMIQGYQSVRSMSKDEVNALSILCRGSALRFLLTRLYDWLNVPPDALVTPHDPLVFAQRLKFHQDSDLTEVINFSANT